MLQKLHNSNSCQSNAVIDKKITDLQNEVDTISDNVTALTGDVAQNVSDIQDLQTCIASGVFENNVEAQTIQADNGVITDKIAPNVESDVCIYGGIETPKVVATDIETTTLKVNNVPFTSTLNDIQTANANANCAKSIANTAACNVSCVEARVDAKLESLDSNVTTCCIAANDGTINTLTTDAVNVTCELDTPRIEVTEVVNSIRTVKDTDKFVEPTAKDADSYYLWKLPKKITGRYQLIGVAGDDILFSIVFDSNNTANTNGMNQVTYAADDKSYVEVIAKNNADNQLFFASKADVERLYIISDTLDTTDVPDYEIYPSLSTLPEFSVSILTTQPNHTYFFGDETSLDGGVSVCGRFDATLIGGEGSNSEFDNIYIKCNIGLDYDPDNNTYCSRGKDGGIVSYANGKPHWVNDGCPRTIVRKSACCRVDELGCECSVLEFENVIHSTSEFIPNQTDKLFDELSLTKYKGCACVGGLRAYPITEIGDCSCVHGCIDVQSKVITNLVDSHTSCTLMLRGDCGLNVCSCCCMNIRAEGNLCEQANNINICANENYIAGACCNAWLCARKGRVFLCSVECSITACACNNLSLISGYQVYLGACHDITEYSNNGCITRTAARILDSAGNYTVCAPIIALCGNVCVDSSYGLDAPYLCTQNIISNYCLRTNVACNYVENVTLNKCSCACNFVTDACNNIVNKAGCSFCICAPVTNIDNTTNVNILKVKCCVDGRLEVNGDVRAHGQLISEGDTVVHGDLLVDGSITTNCQEEIVSTGDYITLRENNNTPLTSNTYSGIAVNNYANGCMATITADYCGEWRVSDSSTVTSCSYTDVSNYNGNWYSGLTQTTVTVEEGIHKNIDFLELSDVVLYNGSYYHHDGSEWYGPISVVSGHFDIGSLITDAATISTLSALTPHSLVYYISLTVVQIDASANQPLLTRDEASCFNNNDLLSWDSTNRKATNVVRPVLNNTVLTAQIDSLTGAVSYIWKSGGSGAICCYPSRACANAAILIQEGCDGYVPDNAQIIIDNEVNYVLGENR